MLLFEISEWSKQSRTCLASRCNCVLSRNARRLLVLQQAIEAAAALARVSCLSCTLVAYGINSVTHMHCTPDSLTVETHTRWRQETCAHRSGSQFTSHDAATQSLVVPEPRGRLQSAARVRQAGRRCAQATGDLISQQQAPVSSECASAGSF